MIPLFHERETGNYVVTKNFCNEDYLLNSNFSGVILMKVFKINEQQLQNLANVLGEFPAKQVLASIDVLRALPEIDPVIEVQPE